MKPVDDKQNKDTPMTQVFLLLNKHHVVLFMVCECLESCQGESLLLFLCVIMRRSSFASARRTSTSTACFAPVMTPRSCLPSDIP